MTLETTVKASKLARRKFTQSALYYREKGNRKMMRIELNLARFEVANQRYFLGPAPF